MTQEERAALSDKAADGEFLRPNLIRFGYLSEVERRRLIATYPDLERRFERPIVFDVYVKRAIVIFFAFVLGMVFARATIELYVIGTILYWGPAVWVLRNLANDIANQTETYWEWRGYRCNRQGGKVS